MYKFNLVSNGVSFFESMTHLKFRSYFGDYEQVELRLEDEVSLLEFMRIVDELFEYSYLYDGDLYFLLSNTDLNKTIEVHTSEDVKRLVDEVNQTKELLALNEIPEQTPQEGIYVDETFIQTLKSLQPLVDPNDINDLSYTPDDYAINPWMVRNPNIFSTQNAPKSYNEIHGIDIVNQVSRSDDIVIRNRLMSLGAALPYLSEADLYADFDRLSRMDEVTDSDLVELIKVGFDNLGKVVSGGAELAGKAYDKYQEHKKNKQEEDDKSKDESNKQKVADKIDKIEDELDDAKYRNDEHIKAARSIANEILKIDDAKGEQMKDEIKSVSNDLPPKE